MWEWQLPKILVGLFPSEMCAKILGLWEEERKRRGRAVETIIFILFVVAKSYGRELRVPYHRYPSSLSPSKQSPKLINLISTPPLQKKKKNLISCKTDSYFLVVLQWHTSLCFAPLNIFFHSNYNIKNRILDVADPNFVFCLDPK